MSDKKVWLVTGVGRGLGVDIANAALTAGHAVVATGRNPEKVGAAVGEHDERLAVKLDVTDPADAEAAVAAAVDRFGRIDVLVNNAGNFNAGFFEELSPEEFRAQIETTFFGPVNVTRAALHYPNPIREPAAWLSHLWSHSGTFSRVRVGLNGLPLRGAGCHRTRPIHRPQNSKAREVKASAGSNPAATAS
jgi:NAD(P)-dependent dehydrogenase (short-subunit alcohol dehydrogenase family)